MKLQVLLWIPVLLMSEAQPGDKTETMNALIAAEDRITASASEKIQSKDVWKAVGLSFA
jgi:hypothetical protein